MANDRWEYKVIEIATMSAETQLNNYGMTGWELVAIGGRYGEFAYLKRRREGERK